MMVEMGARSQVTLPNEVIKSLGLSEGDRFEVHVNLSFARFSTRNHK